MESGNSRGSDTLTGRVIAVAVTVDGKRAISASLDGTLKVWDLETEKVITTFVGDRFLCCCAVAPDGLITVMGGDSSAHIAVLNGL